ncbi:MAG TPA: hypothetical protein EYG16_03915 [Deltaproteobacteria bacterium]|nr:hypothetical protein [Candidatus Binatota bacterium]HIL12799.1 hypothetical protein [Deltaproteobacteria bacterium]
MTVNKTFQGRGLVLGLVLGLALGLTLGAAGGSLAGFSKKGWGRVGLEFKQGYMAGFVDALRVAKNQDPTGWMTKNYRVPKNAKAIHWVAEVDRLYNNPLNANREMAQIMVVAGRNMVNSKKFGPDIGSDANQAFKALQAFAAKKQMAEAAKKKAEAEKAGAESGDDQD